MAKRGIESAAARHLIKTHCVHKGWSLCLGAGASLNADGSLPSPFPLWSQLVERLVKRADPSFPSAVSASALAGWSHDTLIQAARNRLEGGASDERFSDTLSTELYAELQAAVGAERWPQFAACLEALRPADRPRAEWDAFLAVVEQLFPTLTSLGLAGAVSEVVGTELAPTSILTFNAEPLCYALLNGMTVRRCEAGEERQRTGRQCFDRVTRAVSARHAERIPYVFCHGLLPVPGGKDGSLRSTSADKLVFSESEYLQLANTSFSWQSSAFLHAALTNTVVFIGLSMTDPNMRRWLSWIHDNRRKELSQTEGLASESTAHYWIHKAPASAREREWIELSMEHLGVRLVWVESWSRVAPLLRDMLGLDADTGS